MLMIKALEDDNALQFTSLLFESKIQSKASL